MVSSILICGSIVYSVFVVIIFVDLFRYLTLQSWATMVTSDEHTDFCGFSSVRIAPYFGTGTLQFSTSLVSQAQMTLPTSSRVGGAVWLTVLVNLDLLPLEDHGILIVKV